MFDGSEYVRSGKIFDSLILVIIVSKYRLAGDEIKIDLMDQIPASVSPQFRPIDFYVLIFIISSLVDV